MAYEPTVWQTGDVVTAEKMNKLEQGVASGGSGMMIVHISQQGVMDKTWHEIDTAIGAGKLIYTYDAPSGNGAALYFIDHPFLDSYGDNKYHVTASQVGSSDDQVIFVADSENDYPYIDTTEPVG